MTAVFLRFLNLSITAGWMVLAVLLLRLCLKKAPRWITCVLWGLVALRLVLPFSIESSVSLIPTANTVVSTDASDTSAPVVDSGVSAIDKPLNDWLQAPVEKPVEKPSQQPIVQSPLPQTPPSSDAVIEDDPVDTKPVNPAPSDPKPEEQKPSQEPSAPTVKTVSRMEKILNVVAPVWLVGIGLMLLYEIISVLRVRSRVLDAVRLRDNVWQSDHVSSPFIFGFFRPRIYVPYGLEEPVLEQVLSHEKAHLHRRDHWIKPFAFTLLAVYWYNPLLWVGYILLCRDIEVACDERVVRSLDEDSRRQYATALLQCGVERRSIAACPLAFGEVSIKQRIKSVLNYRKPLLWVIIASLVVCAVAAVCLLTVPKSKPTDSKPKDTTTEEEVVVLSTKEIKPDQERLFHSTDTDGALVEAGRNWMWEHAENPDDRTPNIEYWYETDVPLVVSHSKADLDALMDACSDDEWDQVDMRDWLDLEKYDDAFFEDKVLVWLHVPGYNLGYYEYTITLEETNKGLRYAVSLDYRATSMFEPFTDHCEYLLLFETDRKVIEEAKSLTTRHEQAPFELPEEEGLTMVSVGNADMDGDGEAEDIRLYHSEADENSDWDSGYDIAYLVVCKKDGTPILRECTLYYMHSQCYLVPQEDGSSLLLLLEAGDIEYAYSDEHFGVLSLKDGERTVLDDKYESMHPTGWNGISFGTLAPYVRSLSGWMENAQLLYECDNGTIYHGDTLGDTARYRPLCWLDEYRNTAEDTVQDVLENILVSLNGETVSCGEMDFDGDGDKERLSFVRYVDEDGIYQHSVLVVRQADGSILTAADIHYDYVNETRRIGSYVYRIKTENGYALKMARQYRYSEGLSVYDLSVDGSTYINSMSMAEWLEYVDAHDGELLFYFQGLEIYFPESVGTVNFSLYKDVSAADLTDQQARELAALLVDRQIEIHFLAWLDWDKVDTTVKCPFDENYVLCTDLRFSCVQDIRNFVLQALTAEAAQVWFDRHLDGPYNPPDCVNRYIDYDGKLWTDTYSEGAGWSQTFLTDTARIVSRTENAVTIEMDTLYFGTEDNWRYTPTLVKTEAGWRLASPDFGDGYEDTQNVYLTVDPANDAVENYNESIAAYNTFLRGLRVAHEYGELDSMFYVSDLDATMHEKGIRRYALADVTGDGVPELITYGYEWNIFTYQSGRLLRLYKSAAGLYPTRLLSNGCLWEERLGGGNYYRYTKFFAIGTTRTVEFGDPGYDTDEKLYYVDGEWMYKADFDAKTATYFANAKSPALLIWYDYTTKQPTSQAMVQYLSLLQNQYQNRTDAYYALHDADGDGTQELLVKVGENVVVGLPQSNPTLSNTKDIDWVSFKDEPVYLVDMTFDGFQDVAVFAEDCAYSKSYAVLRWDANNERLVLMPTVLENPAVDTSISKIRTSRSGDQIVSYSMWDYDEEKKDFVRTHSLYFHKNEQATGDDDNMKLVVEENGVEKTLYVRGEPYALDKTDPQVAPYYEANSLWCLYSNRWENYIFTKDVDELSYNTYALLLQEEYDNQIWLREVCRDLNGDGQEELLLLEDGTNRLIVYTMKDGYTHLLVNQGFASGTSRFLDTGDADYPGIIYFCVGGGKDRYYYLTLDSVENGEFVEIPLWTDNYGSYEEGEEGRITELSDDKKLIELSRKAYEQDKDIYFSLIVTESHDSWVRQSYGNAMRQYYQDPDIYRDLGELQPETSDIVLLDGQQYQSYIASNVNMRYIFVSNEEYEMAAKWDWVPIGTCDDYSLDNMGKIDDGQRGEATAQPMVRITYSTSSDATLQEMEQSCSIIEQRLTAMGMSGYRIAITVDNNILLEVPRSYYPGNLTKLAYNWGSQGEFAICVGDTEDGVVPMPPEDTVLDYRHVSSAEAVMLPSGEYAVTLTFTAEGADLLADITTKLAKTQDYLYVHMDWQFWDTLQVLQPITDGECIVTGFASWEAAALFAAKINAGLLPYNLSAGVDFSLVA